MKVLFAGPSLSGTPWAAPSGSHRGIELRGPASQGDIALAVVQGATGIGLIDGRFEDVAAVWHKEILYALERGVAVFGAASMGALRAAECAAFGMVGVGRVFQRYVSDDLTDDAAVAQLHAPAELGYLPLTEALVNVEATLQRLLDLALLRPEEAKRLDDTARRLFFKERTYDLVLGRSGLEAGSRGQEIRDLIRTHRVDVKREDAFLLVDRLIGQRGLRSIQTAWRVQQTKTWVSTLERSLASASGPSAALPR
jgi:hypothetical protein